MSVELNKSQYIEVIDLINTHHKEMREGMEKGFENLNTRVTEMEKIVYTHKLAVTIFVGIITTITTMFSIFHGVLLKVLIFLTKVLS